VLIALLTACHRNQVRVRVSDDLARHEWRDPVSARSFIPHYRPMLYVIELPIGYARGRSRPSEGFIFNAQLRWNATVQPVVGLLADLCERHNRADITVTEFTQRRDRLLGAVVRLVEKKTQLNGLLEAYQEMRDSEKGPAEGAAQEVPRVDFAVTAASVDRIVAEAAAFVEQLRAEQARPPTGDGAASVPARAPVAT